MDRYRSTAVLDDAPIVGGDTAFQGMNSYDARENLQPGEVSDAVNIDFTSQKGDTRGGFVALPNTDFTPFEHTWTLRSNPVDKAWRNVVYGNGTFVAVAQGGGATEQVMTSTDGLTWTSRDASVGNAWWGLTYGNGIFVAVASTGTANRAMTSPDGVTWTTRTTPAIDRDYRAVAYGNGIFAAVAVSGTGTRAMSSPNGTTWTLRAVPQDNDWNSVTFGNGTFVAVASSGTGNRVMTSTDGTSWTIRSSAENNSWVCVTYGKGLFVAVSYDGTNRVMTSPDGITWTARSVEASSWSSVTYGNGLFVAVANNSTNRVMTSRDGITWTAQSAASAIAWSWVTHGANMFVAVAETGVGRIMTSPDGTVYGNGIYSDPADPGSQWIMIAGMNSVGFYASGRQSRTINIDSAQSINEPSTLVQCNNQVYIFRGSDDTPLYWTGNWADEFELAPTPSPGPGFSIIPNSNQATYYQNRLWVIDGKDTVAASDSLDFTTFDELANDFNLNTGDSDYLVTTYPFGLETLIVFKNKSILALQNVAGSLADAVATEITRQVGVIGINAVVSVGPDVVYMSDRNINLLSLTTTNNALQHKTLPLSTPIQSIIRRVNWNYGYKVSMAYWDNKLFVALPLDNSTTCNSVVVYNFVTEKWFGEWNFADELGMAIQGWAVVPYLGATRLHCITEDGRIFVTSDGFNDISGTTVAEISTSMTTRAYRMNDDNRYNRRMYADLSSNRPTFSIYSYVEGASEGSAILEDQTYSRAVSWIFNDSTYDMDNSNDDYNRAFRQDYASGPDSIESGTGFLPEMLQDYRIPILTRRNGRLTWFKITNTQGRLVVSGVGSESRPGNRGNYVQV